MTRTRTPTRSQEGEHFLSRGLDKSSLARRLPDFHIHKATLDQLGWLEREFARQLIAEGTWHLISDEATP